MDRYYTCPKCGCEEVHIEHTHDITECPECHSKLKVDVDAEFYNGMWHDRTKLYTI